MGNCIRRLALPVYHNSLLRAQTSDLILLILHVYAGVQALSARRSELGRFFRSVTKSDSCLLFT